MRRLNDPGNLLTAGIAGITRLGQAGADLGDSLAASREARNEAAFERITRDRTLRDENRDTRLMLARARAIAAATGADAGATGVILAGAAERGRRAERIRIDSLFRQSALKARAKNIRRQGIFEALGGIGSSVGTGISVFNRLNEAEDAA